MNNHEETRGNQEIVYEELSLPEESEDERKNSMQLFCDNLELLLANADNYQHS